MASPIPIWRRAWCHILAASFAVLIIVPLATQIFDRRPVLLLSSATIVPDPVRIGDVAEITWQAQEVRRGCAGELRRVIISSAGVIHEFEIEPTVAHELLEQTPRQFIKRFRIPVVSPGPAVYFTHVTRWCSELQRVIWPMREIGPRIRFTILPASSPP